MPATCKACGKELIWLAHKDTGKAAPIEAETSVEGNIVVSADKMKYRIATGEEALKNRYLETGPVLHLNHFARCPMADGFRPKKK